MRGQQHLHKLQSGKRFLKLAILMLLICSTLLGCLDQVASFLPGPGRSDWEIQIFDHYYVIKTNSNSKKICKATDTSGLYEDVLSSYYVTKYCVNEPYIYLEGIPTKELFASEAERTSNNRQYYVIDTRDGVLYGPYDTEDALLESDVTYSFDRSLVWEIVP